MKRYIAIFKQVIVVLSAYKVRTIVAIIGVLLGAMALVIVQNISSALQKKVRNEIDSFGDRVVTAYATSPYVPGQIKSRQRVTSMKLEDIDAIRAVNNIVEVTGSIKGALSVRYMDSTINSGIVGSGDIYFSLRGLQLKDGRYFDFIDRKEVSKVAVIGSEVALKLYKDVDPVGTVLLLNDVPFYVIGVLKEKGVDLSGKSLDNIVIIPLETAKIRVFNRDYLSEILFKIRRWEDFEQVATDVEAVLRYQHGLIHGVENDFTIVNPVDEAQLDNTLIGLASLLGTASAVIAFIIGTVGIFSLMLLIVSQRIVEVGIKRAIGATKRELLFQFIMESGYIGLVGGVCGIVLGIILSLVVCAVASLPYTISLFGAFIGFVAALLSGVVAGIYPAIRASRVVPVKALNL